MALQTELESAHLIKALKWAREVNHSVNELRGNSKSVLQEAFIFMLRFLARTKHLPFNSIDGLHGDRTYGGLKLWYNRQNHPSNKKNAAVFRKGEVLERFWINMFMEESVPVIPGPRCLEWGITYLKGFKQCTEMFDLTYHPDKVVQEGNKIYADIYRLSELPVKFNMICATQVFEHLLHPEKAAQVLFDSLLPGGALMFTAPHSSQLHMVPSDYGRYTKVKVREMFRGVGFCVLDHLMTGGGDFIFDAARALGMKSSDFSLEELQGAYHRNYKGISDGAITIHGIFFKPPYGGCV